MAERESITKVTLVGVSNRQKQRSGAGRRHRQPGGAAGPDSGVPADGQGRPGGLQAGGRPAFPVP